MSLRDVNIPRVLSTQQGNPYTQIVVPCLKESTFFEMGVGFFQSEWVDLAKDGLLRFVENKGHMLLLTSIKVEEDEYVAFQEGQKAKTDPILKRKLVDEALATANKQGKEWTLRYLSWMISEQILEVRLLIHKSSSIHMYHSKLSMFSDGTNTVCTNGSLNATVNGLMNEETIQVTKSWTSDDAGATVEDLKALMAKDWSGDVGDYFLMDLPDIVKKEYASLASSYNPNSKPQPKSPHILSKKPIKPLDYQETAIANLEKAGFCGVLEMATGTGKTYTSLLAAKRLIELKGKLIVTVVVPQTTLIDQWKESITDVFPDARIIVCAFSKAGWSAEFATALMQFSFQNAPLFIVTTYKTLVDKQLQSNLLKTKNAVLYIFDECHNLGSHELRSQFSIKFGSYRFGLSATPARWWDKDGTTYLYNVIGETVYEYSMKEAIEKGKLCKYQYRVILCALSDAETDSYLLISDDISKKAGKAKASGLDFSDKIKKLANDRAKISKTCESKFDAFFSLLETIHDPYGSLVYVFEKQVSTMVNLLRTKYGLKVESIVAETSAPDRRQILKDFNEGHIQILVAIKCLDEGVDVPNCRREFILASSTNPREFIQRRGRVLRISKTNPNKYAEIYDFVTICRDSDAYSNDQKRIVVKNELPRVTEFMRLADKKNDMKLISYLSSIGGVQLYTENIQNPWKIHLDEPTEEDIIDE